jgi:hypothetical protein
MQWKTFYDVLKSTQGHLVGSSSDMLSSLNTYGIIHLNEAVTFKNNLNLGRDFFYLALRTMLEKRASDPNDKVFALCRVEGYCAGVGYGIC